MEHSDADQLKLKFRKFNIKNRKVGVMVRNMRQPTMKSEKLESHKQETMKKIKP